MSATKKSLTTLSVAAALALGGIAVAQTTGSTGASTMEMGSNSALMNNGSASSSDLGSSASSSASSDTSVLGAGSADTMNSDTTLGSGTLAPQADRN